MRFVDLLAPDREPPTPDVFRYQWAATERYCVELSGEGTEASHLSCIVRAAGEAHRDGDIRLLAPALFAYALYLEQESHFEEAEDALLTMMSVGSGRLSPSDATIGTPYRVVTAQAEHGLGNLLNLRGQPQEGAPHLWRAYELYEEESAQLRVLTDLGIVMLRLGHVEDAERALGEVVRRERVGAESLTNALIELMHCASYRGDRVGFERWRERCLERVPQEPPNVRADFSMKAGIGYARFGNGKKSEGHLRQALEIATAHDLNELVFRIEPILARAKDCGALEHVESAAPEHSYNAESLKEVSASLAMLGAES
ncbi:MAG: hypothetical protein DMD40_00425 [Gemmatimonadetes bacterium]|nr:MAG: hypothetical protein DMD40_00425 [Gemmatimonadota bacterium]